MKNRKYTKEYLEPFVQKSKSFRELLSNLDLMINGGNNSHIRRVIKYHKIDTSHFVGQGWRKNKKFPPKRPIEDYLNNSHYINSHSLKLRLIKEGYFKYECCNCKRTEWNNHPIPLELHHKDNNHKNNNIQNLTILCPNCHAVHHQLDRDYHNSISKEQSKVKEKIRKSQPKPHLRKVERPPYEQLKQEIEKTNYCAVGRKYGVSDNAIRKWIKFYEKNL